MFRRIQTNPAVPAVGVEGIDSEEAAEDIDSEETAEGLPEPAEQLPAPELPGVPIWHYTGPVFSQPSVPYPEQNVHFAHFLRQTNI